MFEFPRYVDSDEENEENEYENKWLKHVPLKAELSEPNLDWIPPGRVATYRYMKKPIKFSNEKEEEEEEPSGEEDEEEQYISDFPFSFSEIYYEKEINKLEPNNFSLSESKEKEQIKTLSIQAPNSIKSGAQSRLDPASAWTGKGSDFKKEPTRFEEVNPPKPSIASNIRCGTDLYQNCSKFVSGRINTLKNNKYFTNCQRCKLKIIENAKLYCNLCCEIKNFQTMRPRCFEPTFECNKEVV